MRWTSLSSSLEHSVEARLTYFPRSRSHYRAVWNTSKQHFTQMFSLWSVEPVDDWRQLFYVLLVGAVAILVSSSSSLGSPRIFADAFSPSDSLYLQDSRIRGRVSRFLGRAVRRRLLTSITLQPRLVPRHTRRLLLRS